MNYKHYIYRSSLVICLLQCSLAYAQSFTVDFSNAEGYGVSADKIQINQIGVRWFGPFEPKGIIIPFHLLFKVCQSSFGRLYLRPILTAKEPFCQEVASQADFSHSYSKNMGIYGIQINNIGIKTFDPNVPDHPGTVTSFENITFKFDLDTLDLEQCQVCILLKWRDERTDFDAHLTGPALGAFDNYNHEIERFHLYFSSQYNDVSELKRPEGFGQKQEVFIFPPHATNTLRPGIYRYTVHHFGRNRYIANSGVQVRLWIAGDEQEQLFTPPYQPNNVDSEFWNDNYMVSWVVFELHVAEDGQMTVWPIQRYDINVSPPDVR